MTKVAVRMLLALVLFGFACLVSSCALPQRMPSASYSVLVVDRETKNPIPEARVELIYDGVRSSYRAGASVSGPDGIATLTTSEVSLPMRVGEGYFAGGYLRQLAVSAEGYEAAVYTEGPNGFRAEQIVVKLRRAR